MEMIFFFSWKTLQIFYTERKQHDLKMYAKQIHSLTLLSLPKKVPLSHPSLLDYSTADPKPVETLVKTSTPWSARPGWPGVSSPGVPCSLSLQAPRSHRNLHLSTTQNRRLLQILTALTSPSRFHSLDRGSKTRLLHMIFLHQPFQMTLFPEAHSQHNLATGNPQEGLGQTKNITVKILSQVYVRSVS